MLSQSQADPALRKVTCFNNLEINCWLSWPAVQNLIIYTSKSNEASTTINKRTDFLSQPWTSPSLNKVEHTELTYSEITRDQNHLSLLFMSESFPVNFPIHILIKSLCYITIIFLVQVSVKMLGEKGGGTHAKRGYDLSNVSNFR